MAIQISGYKIICDECNHVKNYEGRRSLLEVKNQSKDDGWVYFFNSEYCSKDCFEKAIQKKEKC